MTIGIDARFFGPKAKGLGRYNQKLLAELAKADSRNKYVVFLRRADFEDYQPPNKNFRKVLAPWRWYSLAEQLFFPWQLYRQKLDLMHFTHFNAPLLYFRPYLVTIHDLILQRFPTAKETVLSRLKYFFKNLGYGIVIRSVLRRARTIIAVSRFVKADITRSFGVPAEKVAVIYEGAPDLTGGDGPITRGKDVLKKYNIQPPYLLYVGNAYPHKNLIRLAAAFKILRDGGYPDLQLVLVGGEDYFYQQLRKKNCDDRGVCFGGGVIFAGFVPDEELSALYAAASLYVFPSLCEGFGLPPLEAMSQGTAVAAANSSCLPEILGPAAHYFDGENPADMAAKIQEVLNNESLRQRLVTQGFERIKKYSWQKMAEETGQCYQEALVE